MQIKNVAVGAGDLWQDVATVGIHVFARHLFQRGCNVGWYSMPLSLLHLLSIGKMYKARYAEPQRKRFDAWRAGPQIEERNGALFAKRVAMTAVHPSAGIPWLSGATVSRNYLKWRLPSLARRSMRDGIGPFDTVLFDASGMEIFFALEKRCRLSVYRISDFAAEYVPQVKSRIITEKEALRKADLLLPVSRAIMEDAIKIRGTDRGVHYLPNGFDDSLFRDEQALPPEYRDIPEPRAVLLAGHIGSTYDWELIFETARSAPHTSVVIIGYGDVPENMPGNIHLLGIKPHDRIPSYLQHAQVGLMPFGDIKRAYRVERPLKFYEYLAAGLPMVSTSYGALSTMADYALLANTPGAFAEAVQAAIKLAPGQRQARREAAQQFSWRARMAEFDAILAAEGISYASEDVG